MPHAFIIHISTLTIQLFFQTGIWLLDNSIWSKPGVTKCGSKDVVLSPNELHFQCLKINVASGPLKNTPNGIATIITTPK